MDMIEQNEMELADGQEAKPENDSDQTEDVNDGQEATSESDSDQTVDFDQIEYFDQTEDVNDGQEANPENDSDQTEDSDSDQTEDVNDGQEANPENDSDQTEDSDSDSEDEWPLGDIREEREKIKERETNKISGYLGDFWSKSVKVKLAAKLMELFSGNNTEKSLLEEIRKNIPDLRKSYTERVNRNYDDARLAGSLFLNGCAVLQFIRSYLRNELEKFKINSQKASKMEDELFKLEYQIPFRVLELLINLTNDPDQLKIEIVDFLYMNIMVVPMNDLRGHTQGTDIFQMIDDQNVHLLGLLHSLIRLSIEDFGGDDNNNDGTFERRIHDNQRYFRNVQELKSAGIEFKPGDGLAISFNSRCFKIRGHLRLPRITIDKWTKNKLMNLADYERSFWGSSEKNFYVVTSYIKFMDFLIDSEQDVKELRAQRIIWNRLSTDKEVADVFNELGYRRLEPPQDVYSNVKTEIQKHCERKCAIWMAQVYHQHFSSPWTMITLLAAAIVLSLTFIQTWYAINPKN